MELMQEQSRYVVGIDVGTKNVRCVVGYIDAENGAPKIVGVGEAPNSGMRQPKLLIRPWNQPSE